jgi:hypothetical protein
MKIDGGFYTTVAPPLKKSYVYKPGTAASTLHCQAAGKGGMDSMFAPGQHTIQAYDAKGALLAKASYTVKP